MAEDNTATQSQTTVTAKQLLLFVFVSLLSVVLSLLLILWVLLKLDERPDNGYGSVLSTNQWIIDGDAWIKR